MRKVVLTVAAALALVAPCGVASADTASPTTVYTLAPDPAGNPEGVAFDGTYFYVGSTGDGAIYRGTVGSPTVTPFIPGGAGRSAVGLKAVGGKLYVAGGATGRISVYDLRSGSLDASFETGTGGFLNDLVVAERWRGGDVYVTDSFRPTLWHVSAAQVRRGSGTPEAISVAPEIGYVPGFNLNGIVSYKGGRELVVVHSATGTLYRIVLSSTGRTITPIDLEPLDGGDGMLIDRGKLLIVTDNSITYVVLSAQKAKGHIVDVRTDPALRGPSTVARAKDRLLVVNADFATGQKPFTVVGLPRSR